MVLGFFIPHFNFDRLTNYLNTANGKNKGYFLKKQKVLHIFQVSKSANIFREVDGFKNSNALTLKKSELQPIKLPNIARKFRVSCATACFAITRVLVLPALQQEKL